MNNKFLNARIVLIESKNGDKYIMATCYTTKDRVLECIRKCLILYSRNQRRYSPLLNMYKNGIVEIIELEKYRCMTRRDLNTARGLWINRTPGTLNKIGNIRCPNFKSKEGWKNLMLNFLRNY